MVVLKIGALCRINYGYNVLRVAVGFCLMKTVAMYVVRNNFINFADWFRIFEI